MNETASTLSSNESDGSWYSSGSFWVLSLFRALFFLLVLFTINRVIDLGTSLGALSLGLIAGMVIGSWLAFSRLRAPLAWLLICASYLLLWAGISFFDNIINFGTFSAYSFLLHSGIVYFGLSLALLSSFHFWRSRQIVSLEAIALGFCLILLLASHRNYHLESPQFINNLAWSLRIGNLGALVVVAGGAVAAILSYLYLATMPSLPVPSVSLGKSYGTNELRRLFTTSASMALLCLFAFGTSFLVHKHYSAEFKTRVMNGVGEEQDEGMSPLNFHSALGSTNQPAGLVRLEGDYPRNPFSPMLYMRESALSKFNGKEMVAANPSYDADISRSRPGEHYGRVEDGELIDRSLVSQSVYLLTKHENAFAIDYPVEIKPLKNKNPKRFKAAYRAKSLVPSFAREDLIGREVGDARWNQAEWQHYLEPHEDPRYGELAQSIAYHSADPITQAQLLIQFLSEKSTYTLTPNHEVESEADKTAPYLFGDLRGYCVHFAHATVYMLRALGIPSRIATGYMTDLSQSKDGHILLRMSDRHAWAEIYVRNVGWVPFDTQPENVESHAETPVDMNLLEELMSMLGPDEELLPPDLVEDEYGFEEEDEFGVPESKSFAFALLVLLLALYATRAYLRFSWLMPGSPKLTLKRIVRAYALELSALGFRRKRGETRTEFEARVRAKLFASSAKLSQLYNSLKYSQSKSVSSAELVEAAKESFAELRQVHPMKRVLLFINPLPQIRGYLRGSW